MTTQPRSAKDLEEAAIHVNYEVQMFRHHAGSNVADNATIEGFLLHGRNLIEFLGWRASSRNTDILAANFVPGWTPPATPDPQFFKHLLLKIDTHLSHLTWKRVDEAQPITPTSPAFPYREMHNLVHAEFAEFTQQAVRARSPGATLFASAIFRWEPLGVARQQSRRPCP